MYSGLRWWDNDLRFGIDPVVLPGTAEPTVSEDWIDPVIGGRVFAPINEDWVFTAHLDLGGFGLESDFTLSASLGLQYQMTHSMILDLKYKALWVDYESGFRGTPNHFAYDTVTHGPIIGVIFEF